MTTLTELATELEGLVPATGGTPATAAYARAVRDAVGDFGYRVPRVLIGTLSVVAGTAAYNLPAGFIRLIDLAGTGTAVFRDAGGYLVPGGMGDERHTISGGQITFHPTPAYTLARTLRYAAGYPYDAATDTFVGLAADGERIALMKAQATALRALAGASAASAGLSYRIGDVSVQRTVTQAHGQLAAELDAAYLDACRSLTGFIGRRASTTGLEF
jgi:hypothetical protein